VTPGAKSPSSRLPAGRVGVDTSAIAWGEAAKATERLGHAEIAGRAAASR